MILIKGNEDDYEYAYEDIMIQLESLCAKLTADEMRKDTTLLLADLLENLAARTKQYAEGLS